jgi:hypothetical protein
MLEPKCTAVVIAAALMPVIASAASAHPPYRENFELGDSVLPGCSFDVNFHPEGRESMTIFDGGLLSIHASGVATMTNADTGFSKDYARRYLPRESFDEDGNVVRGQITGNLGWVIAPGDVGPSGEVDPDGGLVNIVGQLRYTADPETFAITSFTVRGTLTDVCADVDALGGRRQRSWSPRQLPDAETTMAALRRAAPPSKPHTPPRPMRSARRPTSGSTRPEHRGPAGSTPSSSTTSTISRGSSPPVARLCNSCARSRLLPRSGKLRPRCSARSERSWRAIDGRISDLTSHSGDPSERMRAYLDGFGDLTPAAAVLGLSECQGLML